MKNTKRPASLIPCGARQGSAGISISARCCVIIGSSSNDDGDVNENVKTAITTSHVHHTFLFISFKSLYDNDVNLPNFTYCRGREHKATTLFFFS